MDDFSAAADNNRTVTDHIADRVAAEITRRGFYKSQVADRAQIRQSTFSRKINGQVDFTIPELVRVGAALGCDWTIFLPRPDIRQRALSA